MPKGTSQKTDATVVRLFSLMRRLAQGERLYARSQALYEAYGVSERQIERDLKLIDEMFPAILVVSKERQTHGDTQRPVLTYYVAQREDVSDVLYFMLQNNDISYVLRLIHDNDPSIMQQLNKPMRNRIAKALREEENTFFFRSVPFEELENSRAKEHFHKLKNAVKMHEYRVLYMLDGTIYHDAKCLKIVYMHENWYIAIEDERGQFRFVRIAFIDKVDYSQKSAYQKSLIDKYTPFIEHFQNGFSLYGVAPQMALLEASPHVAHYFERHMKPFFPSQRFIERLPNGVIRFEVAFTQPMEILPFVKRWLPDITVIAPQSLRETFREDLESALGNHS